MNVRAGSERERFAITQSVKPAHIEAKFYYGFKAFRFFLRGPGQGWLKTVGVRDWDPPVAK